MLAGSNGKKSTDQALKIFLYRTMWAKIFAAPYMNVPEVKTRPNGNYTIGIVCQNFSSTLSKQEIPDLDGEMGYFNSWSYWVGAWFRNQHKGQILTQTTGYI